MPRSPVQFSASPRPLFNPHDPTLLSSVMRRSLIGGALVREHLKSMINVLPPRPTTTSLPPNQLQTLRRHLRTLAERPVSLSPDDVHRLQDVLFAAWRAIRVESALDQQARLDLVRWHAYLTHALKGTSPTRSR
jgi:hypothetical protein